MIFLLVGTDTEIKDGIAEYYPESEGHEYITARTLEEGLADAQYYIPEIIIIDTTNPEVHSENIIKQVTVFDGIFIYFFIENPRENRKGLELTTYEHIYKPVDLMELYLRVKTSINVRNKMKLFDPITGLFSDRLIEEQFRCLRKAERNWAVMTIKIVPFPSDVLLKSLAKSLQYFVYRYFGLKDELAFVGRTESGVFVMSVPDVDVIEMEAEIVEILRKHLNPDVINEEFLVQMGRVTSEASFDTIEQIAKSLEANFKPVTLF